MTATDGICSIPPEERDLLIEQALLSEIIALHPDRLTPEELVRWMNSKSSDAGRIAILDALLALKCSGLARQNGEVVEPTYTALRADEIFNA